MMVLRVVLGGLFALVLMLPFGAAGFMEFCYYVGTGNELAPTGDQPVPLSLGTSSQLQQALALIAPFLLGFSTSLVILILNQAIEAVQAFVGRRVVLTRQEETAAQQALAHPSLPPPLTWV
jgi:hypothetical protein